MSKRAKTIIFGAIWTLAWLCMWTALLAKL